MAVTKILIVEDEPLVALSLQQQLVKMGYAVCAIVKSGQQALEKIESQSPDLALIDINIEGPMDGIETAARIPPHLNLPVVYVTGVANDHVLERARATRPYGYLIKPFSDRMLYAAVQMALARHQSDAGANDSDKLHRLATQFDAQQQDGHGVAELTELGELRGAERELYSLAYYDSLTGLPNRLLAYDRLRRALDRARRQQLRVAVLFIDLDLFKRVNDTFGHAVGDELLRVVARRMQSCVRAKDTVARLGGDEFVVFLDDVDHVEEVVIVTEKIISAITCPITLAGTELCVSASIGISMFPEDADNDSDLIRAADTAMYAAKKGDHYRYAFYAANMTAAALRYTRLDHELRDALLNDELVLHYQPQLSAQSGLIVGVEALIRWQHPHKGLLSAGDIIPVAEESGLVIDIGDWVMRQACAQMRAWRDEGLAPLRMAVNVSERQMQQHHLIDVVRQALHDNDIGSGLLELEITEHALQSADVGADTLQQLCDLGIALAVDDFGTGYSCLNMLNKLPVQRVKIDNIFVRDIPYDRSGGAVAEAIVAMAHSLNLQVIAEGVETIAQEQMLRGCGCDEMQGYLYGKPMPSTALAQLLRRTH